MKKLTSAAIVACAIAAMTSCGNSTPHASLENDVDSLSYSMGMSQSEGLMQYLTGQLGVDSTQIDEFFKGVYEGASAGDDPKKSAYLAGLQIGRQVGGQMLKGINHEVFGDDSTKTISIRNFLAGFTAGTTGKNGLMEQDNARSLADSLMNVIKERSMNEQFAEYKKTNEKWLADNAKKDSVKTTPSGLQYKVIRQGSGATPKDSSLVKVNYEGRTIEGKVFDSSYKRNNPAEFRVYQLIKGWGEALKLMPVGSKYEVYIPQNLAYGYKQQGADIKPFSTLIFTMEVLEVKDK